MKSIYLRSLPLYPSPASISMPSSSSLPPPFTRNTSSEVIRQRSHNLQRRERAGSYPMRCDFQSARATSSKQSSEVQSALVPRPTTQRCFHAASSATLRLETNQDNRSGPTMTSLYHSSDFSTTIHASPGSSSTHTTATLSHVRSTRDSPHLSVSCSPTGLRRSARAASQSRWRSGGKTFLSCACLSSAITMTPLWRMARVRRSVGDLEAVGLWVSKARAGEIHRLVEVHRRYRGAARGESLETESL